LGLPISDQVRDVLRPSIALGYGAPTSLRDSVAVGDPGTKLLSTARPSLALPLLAALLPFLLTCDSDPTGPDRDTPVREWAFDAPPMPHLEGIVGDGSGAVIFGGWDGMLLKLYGSEWTDLASPDFTGDVLGVWGRSSDDFYLVTLGGEVLRYLAGSVTVETESCCALDDIWGSSDSNIWAAGGDGILLHFDGTAWTSWPNLGDWASAVWGSGPGDIYVVGYRHEGGDRTGAAYHFDGTVWSSIDLPAGDALQGVWGSSSTDVFVVGGSGRIFHFDGAEWTPWRVPGPPPCRGSGEAGRTTCTR